MAQKQSKRFRKLIKLLNSYNLEVRTLRNGHLGIFYVNEPRRVYTFSNSPRVPLEYAQHNTIHDLKKMGVLPNDAKV